MKANKILDRLFLLLFVSLFLMNTSAAQHKFEQKLDCFSIVAGKDATVDGSVIFAHNEDTGLKLVNLYKVRQKKNLAGDKIMLRRGGIVPQVNKTAGFIWINIPGLDVCDSYLNEYGVAVSSDGCPSREKNPELTDGGIVFWLRRIIAQRANSAKEGVKIAGELIDKFGYASSGRTYIIADRNEGWILAVVKGKHWVAQRVPDDEIAVIPNCYTIGNINLSDTVNFLGSPDIVRYAEKQGWYNSAADGEFNFAKAYSNPGSLHHPGNINRWWRGLNLISGKNLDREAELPFAVKPVKNVSIEDIMSVMRDHYEGTKLDKSCLYTLGSPHKMNNATICANGTQYSFVAQLRDQLPAAIGALMWLAPYRPDVQAYVPWYAGVQKIHKVHGLGDYNSALKNQYNPPEKIFNRKNNVAFWTFVSIADEVEKDYIKYAPSVKKEWNSVQQKLFKKQDKQENKFNKIYQNDHKKAGKIITKYSENCAMDAFHQANKMARQKLFKLP